MNSQKTFTIPNELCRRSGVAASWQPVNSIGIFGYANKKITSEDKPSDFSPCSPSVFSVRQEIVLFHPILRKLVNESNGTFLNFQKLAAKSTSDFQKGIIQVSRQYRSVVRACLENLQDEVKKAQGDYKEELQNYITIFYSVECIWHFCEIIFIDTIPGSLILPHLLDWIRFHFPKHERNAAMMLSGDLVGLEENPEYWTTVIGSLIQGRVKVARALLKQHSSSDSDIFQLMDQVLRAMPIYDFGSGMSVSEFNLEWQQWLVDTQSKIDARMFIADSNLNFIAKLIIGDEATWREMQNRCEAWYELMAGSLFFVKPTVKTFELGQFAKKCIINMGLKQKMKHLDKTLLAAMDFDMIQVIREIQDMSENGWFVTHLVDVLFHASSLQKAGEDIKDFSAENLRESFLLDYATLFMDHKSLWQVGLSYMDHCPENGVRVMELLLPRLPLDNESKVRKIIREARLRNLFSVEQTVCKIQGIKSLNRNRIGNALTWALKSNDNIFTSYLADSYLRNYISHGKFKSTDLLDNLGSCMLASDRLIFLGKYYEFHKLYRAKDFSAAASLLISLMTSKIIPGYFWSVLLLDAIPLLESEEILFSSNDTFTILHCLQERENVIDQKEKVDILRLAAARNLARALMLEAQNIS